MAQYVTLMWQLIEEFEEVKIEQVPFMENTRADVMPNSGAMTSNEEVVGLVIYLMSQKSELQTQMDQSVADIDKKD